MARDIREVMLHVRAALELYEAAQDGFAPGEMPVENKLAGLINGAIFPILDNLLKSLSAASNKWTNHRNGMDEKIGAAFLNNSPLAGYAGKNWIDWGNVLVWFNTFLDTPQTVEYPDGTTETVTPRLIIDTDYVKVTSNE